MQKTRMNNRIDLKNFGSLFKYSNKNCDFDIIASSPIAGSGQHFEHHTTAKILSDLDCAVADCSIYHTTIKTTRFAIPVRPIDQISRSRNGATRPMWIYHFNTSYETRSWTKFQIDNSNSEISNKIIVTAESQYDLRYRNRGKAQHVRFKYIISSQILRHVQVPSFRSLTQIKISLLS